MAIQGQMQQQQRAAAQGVQPLTKFSYTYSATLAAVASGANASAAVPIQADSAFMIQALSAFVYNSVTFVEVPSPIATVMVTDTGSGTNLFDAPQLLRNMFGTAQLPMLLPTPRILSPNASMTITLNLIAATNPLTFQLSFIGQKLFR